MEHTAQELIVKIKITIEKRNNTYENRSLTWRESYKGERFKLQTQVLESILLEQQSILDALLDWKEEI